MKSKRIGWSTRPRGLLAGWFVVGAVVAFGFFTLGAGAGVAHAQAAKAVHPDKGVGPIKEVKLGPIDPALAHKGEELFEDKCAQCHGGAEPTGPELKGVTKKMAPEWIMNMILNPSGMLAEDQPAKDLLAQYYAAMPFRDVTQEDARALLEYLRQRDQQTSGKDSKKE